MHYVYILRSVYNPNQLYKGLTSDLKDRLARHNRGEVASTERYKPWRLVFYCAFEDRVSAAKFVVYLKSGSGRAFMKRHLLSPNKKTPR